MYVRQRRSILVIVCLPALSGPTQWGHNDKAMTTQLDAEKVLTRHWDGNQQTLTGSIQDTEKALTSQSNATHKTLARQSEGSQKLWKFDNAIKRH